jgi:integrase
MGRKQIPGLFKRAGIWHIDKRIHGRRVCQSTGSASLAEAERYLARLMEESRQAQIYRVRPTRTFEQAAAKFVIENQHKRSIDDDVSRLKGLIPWIGQTPLEKIHMGSLQPWIEHRQKNSISAGTINQGLQVVRRIVSLAAGEWVDEQGLTWLHSQPKIRLLPNSGKRKPYPLSWEEQTRLFRELPSHLEEMALFAVNTGCRDTEICRLRWDYEVAVPELEATVFIIPGSGVKNGDDRLVILNRIAKSVVDTCRGRHPVFVFPYEGRPVTRMLNSAWMKARKRAGLEQVRVHDLKHTFGRRLRAAGVGFEDRQDLLGHRSRRVTTHYSAVELVKLIEAANRVCDGDNRQPELVVLRGAFHRQSPQIPHIPPRERYTSPVKSLK